MPSQSFENLAKEGEAQDKPVFLINPETCLTRKVFLNSVNRLLTKTTFGRWAGISCRAYMRFDAKEKQKVFRKVSKNLLKSFLRRKRRTLEKETAHQSTAGQQQL